jgi:hypothetical protein
MGWFFILIGVFLICSAAVLRFMFEAMRRRDLTSIGIAPIDRFNNGRFREIPLYIIAGTGFSLILYQMLVTLF